MNRNKIFALSWGRKIFFGIGWPLLCLVALSYFQTKIFPSSALGLLYYIVTLVGHYGLLTAVLYFVFYMPVVCLFPNYYFTRLWSMTLIVLSMFLIFVDSLVYGLYRFHINNFILDLIVDGAAKDMFKLHPSIYIIGSTILLAVMGYIWVSGERTWRSMQRKFSNPNDNWYLVLIGFLVLTSHLMHIYGDAYAIRKITRHAPQFPLYYAATGKGVLGDVGMKPEKADAADHGRRDFKYPSEKMQCSGYNNYNILMITVNDWKAGGLNVIDTPLLSHYMDHGLSYQAHRSGSTSVKGGIFTLLYGLTEVFMKPATLDHVSPVFLDELQNKQSEIGIFSEFSFEQYDLQRSAFVNLPLVKPSTNINEDWRGFLETYLSNQSGRPFFGFLAFSSPVGIDQKVAEIIEGLHAKNMIKKTIILITGTNGEKIPHKMNVPLLTIWPEMPPQAIKEPSSHYDIIPTIMSEELRCTNDFPTYSDGQNLFNYKPKDWFVVGDEHEYQILDYQRNHIITVDPLRGYSVTDFSLNPLKRTQARTELILSVLKDHTRFLKKN
ncbi:MAG TPA: DUF3413 domain-containing protein [Bacteriovoracaceae bacterium]|nr:DUF3413 domain-containing protein [Bacteriovoracaceae bacterium]